MSERGDRADRRLVADAVDLLRAEGWLVDLRVRRAVPVDGSSEAGDGGLSRVARHMPGGFVEAYDRLVGEAFDRRSDAAGGGAGAGTRRAGLSRRAVVTDHRAFEVKKAVDRKLRRLGGEILADLGGLSRQPRNNRCPSCGRLGAADWRYCPEDGQRMKLEDER